MAVKSKFFVNDFWLMDADAITEAIFFAKGSKTGTTGDLRAGSEPMPDVTEQNILIMYMRDGRELKLNGQTAQNVWNKVKSYA